MRVVKMPSLPKASSVRGATNIEPRVLLKVAAAKPMGIMGPQVAIRDIISWSLASSSTLADSDSFTAIKM